MSSAKLKEDLSNCLINFDRRVLITELLDDYKLTYDEVDKIIQNYLVEQEKKDKLKFEKRYLVHGLQDDEQKKKIYKVVDEINLKEWLNKLKNAESSLYSVEVEGGAKPAASVFKPMSVEECVKSNPRLGAKIANTNGIVETSTASEGKKENEQDKFICNAKKETPKEPLKSTAITESSVEKTSPIKKVSSAQKTSSKKESFAQKTSPKKEYSIKKASLKKEYSPTDKKVSDKKSTVKKGITNFFAPSTAAPKKSEDTKETKPAVVNTKPTTPKKMQDFFKKQAETPKTSTENLKNLYNNTSIELFDEEEPEVSSDEEEKLEALKRDIISSDVEMEEDDENKQTTSVKRRRILDSDEDDGDDPPVKQEKLDIKEEKKEAVDETYLEEDGFVVTKKSKQKAPFATNAPAAKKTPPVTMKNSLNETKKSSTSSSKDTKAVTNSTIKTKQAGIKNFFSKK